MDSNEVSRLKHHERQELCTSRPRYRQGKKLTAVKVYSVVDESRYLLIQGVPAIAVTAELENLCLGFGSIDYLRNLPDYPAEKFCEVYEVKFHTLQSARYAKRKMDDRNFYGGVLHVCYAPELETFDDTRNKLISRNLEVLNRLTTTRQNTFVPPRVDPELWQKERPVNEALPSSNHVTTSINNTDALNQRVKDEQTTDLRLAMKRSHSQMTTVDQPRKRIVYHQTAKKVAVVPNDTSG